MDSVIKCDSEFRRDIEKCALEELSKVLKYRKISLKSKRWVMNIMFYVVSHNVGNEIKYKSKAVLC